MPVRAIPKVSIARNGVGTYVQPCHKITIQYCNWGGSSRGVREVLANGTINSFALKNSNIAIEITKKSDHPNVKFNYNNDKTTEVDVKNLDGKNVLSTLKEYSQRSGNDLFKYNHKVLSNNESVRGIWSPLHVHKQDRFKI